MRELHMHRFADYIEIRNLLHLSEAMRRGGYPEYVEYPRHKAKALMQRALVVGAIPSGFASAANDSRIPGDVVSLHGDES